jgi:hypothetical protein
MFGPKHYVPLMRAKDAELRALRDLEPTLRPWVTPMLECPSSALRKCDSTKELQAKLDGISSYLSGWSDRTVFLARGEIHRLRRFEWPQWRNLDSWVGRRPAFGDYTIQHVNFKEPVPVPNVSASIRYTIENEFFVMRGEGVLNEGGPGYGQWNAWAALLIGRPEFFGATFSAGDRYIVDRASDWNSPGTAQTWLHAGFSHHVTTAALQVADRLEQVRQVSARAADWAAVIEVERPDATW